MSARRPAQPETRIPIPVRPPMPVMIEPSPSLADLVSLVELLPLDELTSA